MCTIADAKVRQNYNCYNVYFNECLRLTIMTKKETIKFIVQIIASIATAIVTALGATSCVGTM